MFLKKSNYSESFFLFDAAFRIDYHEAAGFPFNPQRDHAGSHQTTKKYKVYSFL
jgi:hypothetical protein